MKILLTNHMIGGWTGSETWVYTMYNELSKHHEVDIYAHTKKTPQKDYDLALINHNTCLKDVMGWNIKRKVFTSHGVLPELEQPIEGADEYVAVSEEVQANLADKGFKSKVIRNPIDMERFKPEEPVNDTLQNILFLSNYTSNVANVVESACCGYNFKKIGGGTVVPNVEDYMNWADLVVTLGRGVLEALSCNRNVIIADYGGGDGFVTPENILEYRKKNNSGRTRRKMFTIDEFRKEMSLYDPQLKMRDYIKSNNDVKLITKLYDIKQ